MLFKHALRPSLFSFVTVFALTTGALIGGALIVENIFLIPGLGRAIVEAVLREDFPVVLAIVMIVSAAFVVVNLVVELVYSLSIHESGDRGPPMTDMTVHMEHDQEGTDG